MRCELRARRATAAVIGCPVANIGEAAKQIFGVMGFEFDRRWVLLALFVDLLGMLPSLVQ